MRVGWESSPKRAAGLGISTRVKDFVVWGLPPSDYLSRNHNPELHTDRLSLHWWLQVQPGFMSMIESALGIFVLNFVNGLWGREAENAVLYLYRKALILALQLKHPLLSVGGGTKKAPFATRIQLEVHLSKM